MSTYVSALATSIFVGIVGYVWTQYNGQQAQKRIQQQRKRFEDEWVEAVLEALIQLIEPSKFKEFQNVSPGEPRPLEGAQDSINKGRGRNIARAEDGTRCTNDERSLSPERNVGGSPTSAGSSIDARDKNRLRRRSSSRELRERSRSVMIRVLMIMNPISGHGRAQIAGASLRRMFQKVNDEFSQYMQGANYQDECAVLDLVPIETTHKGHAQELAWGAATNYNQSQTDCDSDKPFDFIVTIGGDGLVNEVLNGFAAVLEHSNEKHGSSQKRPTFPLFAVVPVGTGNGIITSLGMLNTKARSDALAVEDEGSCTLKMLKLRSNVLQQLGKHHNTEWWQHGIGALGLAMVRHIEAQKNLSSTGIPNGLKSDYDCSYVHRMDLLQVRCINSGGNSPVYSRKRFGVISVSWGLIADCDYLSETEYRWMGPCRMLLVPIAMILKNPKYSGEIQFIPHMRDEKRDCTPKAVTNAKQGLDWNDWLVHHGALKCEGIGASDGSNGWWSIRDKFSLATVMNLSHLAHDLHLAPASIPDDGIMYLVLMRDHGQTCDNPGVTYVTRAQLAVAFLAIEEGKHVECGGIEIIPVSRVRFRPDDIMKNVFVIDGEKIDVPGQSYDTIDVEVIPGQIRVVA